VKPSQRHTKPEPTRAAIDAFIAGATMIFGIYMVARQFPREIELAIWIYLMVGQLVCGWKRIGPSTHGRRGIDAWMKYWVAYLWTIAWWPRYLLRR
jgi:hypothetical protein